MMTLDELIAALEQATGPSRELDATILGHLGYVEEGRVWRHKGARTLWQASDFLTYSADAALALCRDDPSNVLHEATRAVMDKYDDPVEQLRHFPRLICIAALKTRRAAQ
ncbi:hypothetical protein [Pedomonas sp. V897]|uniref:hypothetical protein n=1 Tax=Pedomonas sp. V897 TaxID=3446482 RepID=UPI003EDFE7C6